MSLILMISGRTTLSINTDTVSVSLSNNTQHSDCQYGARILLWLNLVSLSWTSLCWTSLCWTSLCWTSLCWMSLCKTSLCWMSLRWTSLCECRYAECCYSERHYAERRYAECHYAKRRYDERRCVESKANKVVMMVVGVGNETEKGKVMTKILFGVSNCDIGLEQKKFGIQWNGTVPDKP